MVQHSILSTVAKPLTLAGSRSALIKVTSKLPFWSLFVVFALEELQILTGFPSLLSNEFCLDTIDQRSQATTWNGGSPRGPFVGSRVSYVSFDITRWNVRINIFILFSFSFMFSHISSCHWLFNLSFLCSVFSFKKKKCCRVSFEFQHNVCGRSIYAEGTVDAVLFLAKKVLILPLNLPLLSFDHPS